MILSTELIFNLFENRIPKKDKTTSPIKYGINTLI